MSEFGGLDGVQVMDLYAGSGALGLEALSRGAASVLLVEADARAAAVIKANAAVVGLPGATVATDRVERLLARPRGERQHQRGAGYDLVFADPPYAVTGEAVAKVLTLLGDGWLADEALVVVERATRSGPVDWPPATLRESRAGTVRRPSGTAGTAAPRWRVTRNSRRQPCRDRRLTRPAGRMRSDAAWREWYALVPSTR